jgi:hypothetical protein
MKRKEHVTKATLLMAIESMPVEMSDKLTVCFIRSSDGDVPKISDASDLSVLNSHFEFSVMCGNVLGSIANLMNQIYIPVLQNGSVNGPDSAAIHPPQPPSESGKSTIDA